MSERKVSRDEENNVRDIGIHTQRKGGIKRTKERRVIL